MSEFVILLKGVRGPEKPPATVQEHFLLRSAQFVLGAYLIEMGENGDDLFAPEYQNRNALLAIGNHLGLNITPDMFEIERREFSGDSLVKVDFTVAPALKGDDYNKSLLKRMFSVAGVLGIGDLCIAAHQGISSIRREFEVGNNGARWPARFDIVESVSAFMNDALIHAEKLAEEEGRAFPDAAAAAEKKFGVAKEDIIALKASIEKDFERQMTAPGMG